MATDRKTEPKLAEAAAKTTAALETLRSRLSREAPLPEPAKMQAPAIEAPEAPDDLSRQLEQYFAEAPSNGAAGPRPASVSAEPGIPSEIRSQVIEGVVDRILRSWGAPDGPISERIKSEVIARLVEHVLAELLRKGPPRAE